MQRDAMSPFANDVQRTMDKLMSLQEGDLGETACGNRAIAALRALLFEREPSGLYPARCRAVAALAALGAYDVRGGSPFSTQRQNFFSAVSRRCW
jgi:hypothetical protein